MNQGQSSESNVFRSPNLPAAQVAAQQRAQARHEVALLDWDDAGGCCIGRIWPVVTYVQRRQTLPQQIAIVCICGLAGQVRDQFFQDADYSHELPEKKKGGGQRKLRFEQFLVLDQVMRVS